MEKVQSQACQRDERLLGVPRHLSCPVKDVTSSSQCVSNSSSVDTHQTPTRLGGGLGGVLLGSKVSVSIRSRTEHSREAAACLSPEPVLDHRQSNGDLSWPASSSASGIRGRRADRVRPQNFWGDISFLVAVNFHPMWFPQIRHWAMVQAYLPKRKQRAHANGYGRDSRQTPAHSSRIRYEGNTGLNWIFKESLGIKVPNSHLKTLQTLSKLQKKIKKISLQVEKATRVFYWLNTSAGRWHAVCLPHRTAPQRVSKGQRAIPALPLD